ncbi:PQQ-dependent sugar dehydrogenase [Streptomyces sp. B93]|uniref:PQQ-dependent sugar dehydrogenase n=1 Tax=Streptomyces sp. B93 TaxID=2824875 RepID=UPI001B396010|nr:PQQ-dependent sugar dehydrogenase [Streptomyces sp. B93]MBQ1088940.1 PQQ-dependent sugar dehydrogenase [Streptomyces sp. B93]
MHRTLRRWAARAALMSLPLAGLVLPTAGSAAAADDPALDWANYERVTLSKSVGEPIDLAVLPDNRVLHTARNGDLRLTDPGRGTTTVVNHIDVYNNSEMGLQTVTLDPDFDENKWVYLFYAPPLNTPAGSAPQTLPAGEDDSYWARWEGYDLLARFKWTGDGLDLSTKQEIIRVPHTRGQCCHVAGDVDFDADGNLYLATGDNTPASGPNTNGYAPINDAPGYNPGLDTRRGAGNTNDLRGKILRIRVGADGGYTVPEGNLFPPGTEKTRPEIYVMGVRNPFRIDVDDETGAVSWGDYGPDAGTANPDRGPMGLVEWQTTSEPMNSGWPYCTGDNSQPYRDFDFATLTSGPAFDCSAPVNDSRWNTGLTTLPPAVPATLWYGDRDTDQPWPELTAFGSGSGQAPMGGPVYHYDEDNPAGTKFPAYWDGKHFFGEFSQDYVAAFTSDGPDGPVGKIEDFLPNPALTANGQPIWDNPMDMEFGPDGSLYVLDYGDGFFRENPDAGLYRVDYAEGNKSPHAEFTASTTSGQGPLEVAFDAGGSTDPEGRALTYDWDFDGDGTYDATGRTATHTYADDGQFQARLRVTDPLGLTALASRRITVGNTAPTVEVIFPAHGGFFSWGDTVPYEVKVTDPEDGAVGADGIDCTRLAWTFGLGHNEHAHPVDSGTGCAGTVVTPQDAGHGATENVFGVLGVTYTDGGGSGDVPALTGEAQVVLNPSLLEAEHADVLTGVEVTDDETASGLRKLTSFDEGDRIAYDPVDLTGIGAVRTVATGAGELQFRWDSATADPFATVRVPAGDGWQTVTTPLTEAPSGTGVLYVTSSGGVTADAFTFTGPGVADKAGPEITVLGLTDGAGYGDSATPGLSLTAEDAVFGEVPARATLDGDPVTAGALELWRLPLGTHELLVSAEDPAGNRTTTKVTFTTRTSFTDVRSLVERFHQRGLITDKGVGELLERLDQARRHAAAGRDGLADKALDRFIALASDRHLVRDTAVSAALVRDAGALKG